MGGLYRLAAKDASGYVAAPFLYVAGVLPFIAHPLCFMAQGAAILRPLFAAEGRAALHII